MIIFEQLVRLLVVIIGIQVAGCATKQVVEPRTNMPVEERNVPVAREEIMVEVPVQDEPVAEPTILDTPTESRREMQQPDETAIVALLEDADRYASSGKQDQAAASLERALRIEPKNPLLWQRLGLLRLKQGQWQQSIALAQKSNSLARNNKRMQLDNWKIIKRASEAAGDTDGAKEAKKMIQLLSE